MEETQETLQETLAPVTQEEQVQEQPTEIKKQEQDKIESHENFKRLEKKAWKAEKERDELLRLLGERGVPSQPQQVAPEVNQEEEEIRLAPDDLAEGKHLLKVSRRIKQLEDQVKKYQYQSAESIAEAKLKSQYPDFERVVSRENVEALRNAYPELANTINSSPDLYSKAVSAYTLIKKLGIEPDNSYDADKLLAQRNAAKPKPLASVSPQQGDTPLSKANAFANGLTDELREQLRKEMFQAMKNK